MDFQIIKFDRFDEIVLIKTGFGVTLEFLNGGFEPDWLAKIKLIADFIQGMKDLMCTRIAALIADDGILQQMVILKNLCP